MLDCPFCSKKTIKVFIRPPYRGFKTARGSGVSNTFQVTVEGQYKVLNGCPECGKSKTEVEKALFG